ncbi:MAG TPA: hypothetical protein VHP37_29795 [Burkholderiales bacterium]|nr:hypothetical protein [Burkholderiales bacterium]
MQSKKMKIALAVAAVTVGSCALFEPKNPMTFFVTSTGSGQGANLGGLSGADALCEQRAASVDAAGPGRTWRAYLSGSGSGAVNARDRIGSGPWRNAKGVVVATSVADLHSANNKLSKQNSVSEKGEVISGRGDPVNRHDVLTGSSPDGRALPGDATCNNWTSAGSGSAMVGHIDRMGLRDDDASKSWNSSHPTKGCSQDNLKSTGGDGLIYCFASK